MKKKSALKKSGTARVPTGIQNMDMLIGGGLIAQSLSVLRGETGSGKTIFALQFLYMGAKKFNEPGIYLSFTQDKDSIYRQAKAFGWDLEKLESEGKFAFLRYDPNEVASIIEDGGGTIRDFIENMHARRLVIDSITSYLLLFENQYKENRAIIELFRLLKNWKCTSIIISEAKASLDSEGKMEWVAVFSDTVINFYHLRKDDLRIRALEVLKMRDSAHVEHIIPFKFSTSGIEVHPHEKIFGKR